MAATTKKLSQKFFYEQQNLKKMKMKKKTSNAFLRHERESQGRGKFRGCCPVVNELASNPESMDSNPAALHDGTIFSLFRLGLILGEGLMDSLTD